MYGIVNSYTKDELIDRQEEIYSWLFGYLPKEGNSQRNTIRGDTRPNCTFEWRNNKLIFKDWAQPDWNGDVFQVTKKKYNLNSFPQVLDKINTCCNFSTNYKSKIEKKQTFNSSCEIKVIAQPFSEEGLNYWNSYGISKTQLQENNIFEVKKIYYRNKYKQEWHIITPKSITFAYYFSSEKIKIYSPLEKNNKFFGNTNYEDIYGELFPSKKLIITKSGKDRLVLNNLTSYCVIATNGEGYGIPDRIIDRITEFNYEEVIILYDNDNPGIQNAIKLGEKHNFRVLYYPLDKPKDTSDYYKYNKEELKQFLKQNL